MVEEDLERWLDFKANAYPFENLTREQELKYIKLICELHQKYYHPKKYIEPCTCNGAIYKRWIADLDKLV
jgi:hypothetical protein